MADLEQIIADSVNDAQIDSTPEVETVAEDPTPEVVDVPTEEPAPDTETPVEATTETSSAVSSPANRGASEPEKDTPQDDFEALAGIQQNGVGGRENRIPYSRVKKITEKAVGDVAEVVLGRKLNQGEKATEVVKAQVEAWKSLEPKVADYEARLETVGNFENVMANEPQKFLTMLSKLPAYADFFQFVNQALAAQGQPQATPQPGQQPAVGQAQATPPPAGEGMPEPDETLSDGSKVYSMDGLKALLAWNANQTEARVTKRLEEERRQLEERYEPIAADWQARQRQAAVMPVIQKQIAEARTWHLFNESEAEIIAALEADKSLSLDGAYRKVVFPKLIADRNKVRQDVIKDIKQAPVRTGVTPGVPTKPNAPSGEPKSIEDIIREQIATKLK